MTLEIDKDSLLCPTKFTMGLLFLVLNYSRCVVRQRIANAVLIKAFVIFGVLMPFFVIGIINAKLEGRNCLHWIKVDVCTTTSDYCFASQGGGVVVAPFFCYLNAQFDLVSFVCCVVL